MNISPWLANKIARWIAGTAMPAAPAQLFVGLWNGDPLAGGSEVGATITGGAARREVSTGTPPDDGSTNVVTSDAVADFGASVSATPVPITHITVSDAGTGGNYLGIKELDTPRTVNQTDIVRVQIGDFTFTIQKYA